MLQVQAPAEPAVVKEKKAYWYRYHVGECQLCGSDQGWKERVYGEKPKEHAERYVQIDNPYCGCGRH